MANTAARVGYSKEQHAHQTDGYGRYVDVPFATLEHQLHEAALGDCTGITVLDLGGGQGLRARQIVDKGAAAVDVVDCKSRCLMPTMVHDVGFQPIQYLPR